MNTSKSGFKLRQEISEKSDVQLSFYPIQQEISFNLVLLYKMFFSWFRSYNIILILPLDDNSASRRLPNSSINTSMSQFQRMQLKKKKTN